MTITLKLFASLRERTGVSEELLALPVNVSTLGALREHLRGRSDAWSDALDAGRAVRGAINQRMAQESDPIADGDEVAFFPPVTGG